jgi:hypothetical protein
MAALGHPFVAHVSMNSSKDFTNLILQVRLNDAILDGDAATKRHG